MSPAATIRKYLTSEDGSFMNTVVFLAIVIIFIGIIVIDGTSVFYANQAVSDGSQQAANLAFQEYRLSHSDTRAETAAADYCEQKELDFLQFSVDITGGHTFDVVCGKPAKTYTFKYLPGLKDLTYQESRKTSNI
jgi:Flp pilus assembly protein TadG